VEAGKVICDSDVVIDFFEEAKQRHEQTVIAIGDIGEDNIVISAITKMEVIKGTRDRLHGQRVMKNLKRMAILPLSHKIGLRATDLLQSYHLSHGLEIADALIAATAIETDCPLFTYNTKDFRFIKGLRLFPS